STDQLIKRGIRMKRCRSKIRLNALSREQHVFYSRYTHLASDRILVHRATLWEVHGLQFMDCVVDALSRGLCVESRLSVLLIRRAACRSQPSPHSDSVINLGGGCGADHCCAASLYQAAVFLARRGLRSRVATRSFSGRNLWATRVRPILSENLSWCHRA